MYKGIDVSSHNGSLDWNAIKNDGIQFAIIRIGFGNDELSQDDSMAVANMDACQNLNIPYGVYIYSYAINEDEIRSEVQHTLRMISGKNPELGVFIDMEDSDGYKARHGLVEEENTGVLTNFCCLFCDEIINAGYKAGVYANKYYFDNILDVSRFENYMKWLAIWGPSEVPAGDWDFWQYTSDGIVNGSSSRTDLNYYYGELPGSGSVENPPETPVENPPETPVENPPETPVENPPETPVENPPETPVENPPETPVENPPVTPVENPPEAPKKKNFFQIIGSFFGWIFRNLFNL